ncbi:MAG: tRNA (adenosine(37)-N6)-threonylcarbamoyltransferase complex dimerization subunit type 1 TsaB [Planctomycetaceae bacterium]|nr:tRNA (adenosine(37)-N6)-threonylcarbamoyltransferase complex dimerization subunit type 1 TsaB [Planctomycetaceae bacterium]
MPPIQKFLAIETSTSPGSVAAGVLPSRHDTMNGSIQNDNRFVQESLLPETGTQGRHLMPALTAAAKSAGWSLDMTDLVIVATGPGPFTGLRVGITTAKAIAWTNSCPLVGVSTVSCLATQAISECGPVDRVEVIFDAGRGELFVATATQPTDGLIWQVSDGTLKRPEEWRIALPRDTIVTGPGLALQHEVLQELQSNPGSRSVPPASAWHPNSRTLARIGIAAAERGLTTEPATLSPTYLRASYAEDRSGT